MAGECVIFKCKTCGQVTDCQRAEGAVALMAGLDVNGDCKTCGADTDQESIKVQSLSSCKGCCGCPGGDIVLAMQGG